MSDIYKWRVYCEDESNYQYWYLDNDETTPTTCPNNTSHVISSSLTTIVDTILSNKVEIKQEIIPTGERYFFDTQQFTALANQTTEYSFSYPIAYNLLDAEFISATENIGDTWSWVIYENTTIGTITSDVSISDTVINVSSTVINNIDIGFFVNLYDGVNTEELARVIAIDSVNNTITVETASSQAFLASTPTFVRMSVYFCKDMEFGHPWGIVYGGNKIKSTYLPANTTVKVSYTNKSLSDDKRIVVYLELLYGKPQ